MNLNINQFPKDFDVKSLGEDLNTCDKCGSIQDWATKMYWQATDGDDIYHECMGDTYTAVCDDCFFTLYSRSHQYESN